MASSWQVRQGFATAKASNDSGEPYDIVATCGPAHKRRSLHLFEIGGLPLPVEGGRVWSVDAEVDEPSLSRQRLDPPAFLARRRGRPEVQIDGRT